MTDGEPQCAALLRAAPPEPRNTSGRGGSGARKRTCRARLRINGPTIDHGTPNVLGIVPQLRISVAEERRQFVEPLIGQERISVPISLDGSPVPEPHPIFRPDRRLARQWGNEGARYTRVSAVVVIEERYHDRAELRSTYTAEHLEDAVRRAQGTNRALRI